MPISSKSRNKILDLQANNTNNNNKPSIQQEIRYNSSLLKNFQDKKFFFKRKVFIDGINGLEFVKLEKLLLKLKAEVLESFDETLDYVIVPKSQLAGLNTMSKNGNQYKTKQNGNLLTLDTKLIRSRQIQKLLNSAMGNNNNKPPISNEQSSHFIAHCQRNNVPILCISDVWRWITTHYSRLIQNVEIVKENKILDNAQALRVIDDPGFKISDETDTFVPIYKAKSNYMPKYWEEEYSIDSNKSSTVVKTIETSQAIESLEVTKKVRKSNNLLKPSVENVKIIKKKVEPVKLYCECCHVTFKDTIKHLETPSHLQFSNDPLNFQGFGENFSIDSHLKEFLSTRIRKQKAIERIENRKLIKKLSVNDFKSANANLLSHSSTPVAIEKTHNDEIKLINENESALKMNNNQKELNGIESIVKGDKADNKKISKGIEVTDKENENNATDQKITDEAVLKRLNDQIESDGIESIMKEKKILKIVIEKNTDGVLVINKKRENKENCCVSQMELDGIESIGKEEKIESIVIGKNKNGSLVINKKNSKVTRNNTVKLSDEKVKSTPKKRSKLSLKPRPKPLVASHEELLYESRETLHPVNMHNIASESDIKYEYAACVSSQMFYHTAVIIKHHQYAPEANELQPMEIVEENRAISHDVSYNVVEFDQKFVSFHQFFVPLDVLSSALGQCDKMTVPNFVELHPISVTRLSRAVTTTVIQSQQPTLASDISYFQKVTEEKASVSVICYPEVGIASVVTVTRGIDANIEIINLRNDNETSSEEEESLSDKLNDSVGSSIEMLSLCRYNINLHSTPESVKTPLSPSAYDSKNLAFSPFILRSAKKACANGRFSPDIEVSPLRYGKIDSSCFRSDTFSTPATPDPILNLKQIIMINSDVSSSCRFDVLSSNNCSLNSKSKPQPSCFSVDSFVENHFREKFDMKLISEKIENRTKQKRPTKRRRPANGFQSSSDVNVSDDEQYESLSEFIEIEHQPKRKCRKVSNEIISESPLSHRPFRRAKYIARESISISTNLFLN